MGDTVDGESISEAVKEKRRLRDEEDEKTAREAAQKTLSESGKHSNPVTKRTKQWTLRPSEIDLFYKALTDPENPIATSTDMDRIFPDTMRGNIQ